jgi:hypothetical protein
MKNKRLIFIILIVAVVLIAVIIFYFSFVKKKTEPGPAENVEGKITESVMEAAKLSPSKEWVYFYSSQNLPAFYRFNLNNQNAEQISQPLSDVQDAIFSPDTESVIFRVSYDYERFKQYGSPFIEPKMEDGEQRFWTYKFAGKKLSYLDQNITNVV